MKISEGFIVILWDKITYLLSCLSLHFIITKICFVENEKNEKEKNKKLVDMGYVFTEVWVAIHTIMAILSSIYVYYTNNMNKTFFYLIVIYGMWRSFEITICQIRILFFDTIGKKSVPLKSIRRSIILLIHNYIEVIFWFTAIVILLLRLQDIPVSSSWIDFVISSTLVMTVFGDDYTEIIRNSINNSYIAKIAFLETMIGFIMIVIAFARMVGMLPKVKMIHKY